MMKTVLAFLYRVGILKVSTKAVARWVENRNLDKLTLALEYGIYDVRKAAIEGLTSLKQKESIPLLERFLDDPVQLVSESAMVGLSTLTSGNDTTINEKIKQKKAILEN